MNRAKIKNYGPQARRDFLQAVKDRAAFYGLTADRIEPVMVKGDVAIIAGRAFPRAVDTKRKALQERVERDGYGPTMEALAYTWFNRLVAIRYMELHGYLDHGYRVLSNPDPAKSMPEILEQAEHVELPGLNRDRVIELKLDGAKEAELYRTLLVAQCNALHSAMPFLFERIGDETELVLPEGLLYSDSIVRKLVSGIDEEDWQEVEIIGWLYQFYISDKKDEVIGKVVASDDIPAATQLFTPNWIVKYLVQNTLGGQWLATYPHSDLRQQMPYYIEPALQTPQVQEQLRAITPTSLNPEELTLLDPACGSGHILAEAYNLFRAIYLERGYRAKDIPALILQKNLYGLEIDDRAAQLAAFALIMKARADDRRIFDSETKPNILAFKVSEGMNAADITHALNSPISKDEMPPREYLFEEIEKAETPLFGQKVLVEKGHVSQGDITSLLALFENAKTFGSLIQVPAKLVAKLPEIEQRFDEVLEHGNMTHASIQVVKPLLQQARYLARQYDAVVANPPYMGGQFFTPTLKTFAKNRFAEAKSDLFAMFIRRGLEFTKPGAMMAMVTMESWMFLSSHEQLRSHVIENCDPTAVIHIGYNSFPENNSKVARACAFSIRSTQINDYAASYINLNSVPQSADKASVFSERDSSMLFVRRRSDFCTIPGQPLAYWISKNIVAAFQGMKLADHGITRRGLQPGDVVKYVRFWHETSQTNTSDLTVQRSKKWFPFNSGGKHRRWFGNIDRLVNWENNGRDIKAGHNPIVPSEELYFREAVTWSKVTSSLPSFRLQPAGIIPGDAGPCLFSNYHLFSIMAFLNSNSARMMIAAINPTLNMQVGDLAMLPVPPTAVLQESEELSKAAVDIARTDWDSFETSWDFQTLPTLQQKTTTLKQSQEAADAGCWDRFHRMKVLEEQNNHLYIDAYALQNELSAEVPDDQITLYRPNREEDINRLISYAVGCMMGRYSLDKPGLIYAHGGNVGFDPGQYRIFPADPDGIVPLMEADWFGDDAMNRFVEFLGVPWPREHLDENLKFVADSLGPSRGEQPRDTIRRYLATGFYRHHLQIYKRRPIYWLFSSGRQRTFQCLVYLHRYHEGTLSRMRTEYVIPLQGKLASRINQLADDIVKPTSTSHRRKLTQERDTLLKQQAELRAYDETLHHYADRRIRLDLDDGVKVNYGKFGDLLAEVKAVTGGRDEE